MPGHGRIALAYMPAEAKTQAREIADWILRQPGFVQSTERYKELAKQIASHYTMKPEALEEAARKAYEDIRDRVAQEVLKGAAAINRLQQEESSREGGDIMRMEAGRIAHSVWKAAWRALERERTRAEAQALLLAQKEMERRKKREREEARERA